MSVGARRVAGERVGPFEIERYLASGGMGDVYVARAVDGGERVALKFLAQASAANVERFEREGRIAATLTHSHVVAGRGFGRASDGSAWLAMELLEGTDLDERLRTRGLTPLEAVSVAEQVCDALEYAHARRIVHRDLKPQNVWVCAPSSAGVSAPEGGSPAERGARSEADLHIKVLDFGIARLADERRMTGTGVIVGSWSYMSPEQARAEPDLDARSDLWSLGVLLYECLSGRLPFDAPTGPGTLYQILFERPPELSSLAPWLPASLTSLVHRALSRPREERPASASAFRSALAAVDRDALRAHDAPARPPAASRRGDGDREDPSQVGHTVLAGTGEEALGQTYAREGDESVGAVTVENRLTSVVFLRGVREPRLVADVARELQARLSPLPGDDQLVVFGTERWNGDEPVRAVRLAGAVSGAVRAAGVATGRSVRGVRGVAGAAVDVAFGLSKRDGVTLDATTASIVRARFATAPREDGSYALLPRGPRITASIPPGMHGAAGGTGESLPMVGRDAELGVLSASAQTAASEMSSHGVAVLGVAGMGKSRLRQEAVLAAVRENPETTPVVVRCEAFRRDTPFAALTDALRDLVDESVLAALSNAANDAADPRAALDRARSALEAALRSLAARGCVVLAVDDAQWLDAPSQSALRWLADNATDLPLALWLFGRPDARSAVSAVLPEATVLELKPLAKAAAEKLLTNIARAAPEALLERAAGNPLFLEELGRLYAQTGDAGASALPPSVEGASLAQLDALEPTEREYLKRAAVFGRGAWQEAVGALGGELPAYEALRRANHVVPRPRSRFEGTKEFSFRSGVMQEVSYGLWTDEQRARLHERAGEWLAERAGAAPEELARHWDLAGDAPRAAAAYTEAAERAVRVSADAAATLALAERALALVQDPAVRFRALAVRDSTLSAAGDRQKQLEGLIAMEMLADDIGDEQRTEAAWRRCYFARVTSDHEGALAAGRKALELARRAQSARWASTIHNDLALMMADEGKLEAALGEAEQGQRYAEETGDEWHQARALSTRAYVLSERGLQVAALQAFETAARRFHAAGDASRAAQSEVNAAVVALELGREAEAAARFARAIEGSRTPGAPRVVIARQNRAVLHRVRGARAECEADLAFVEGAARRMGHRRLAAAVAIERLYLALEATGARPLEAGSEATALLVEGLVDTVRAARSPAMVLSALSVASRVMHRAGVRDSKLGRELQSTQASAERVASAELEVSVALWDISGDEAHIERGRRALSMLLETIDSPADEQALLRWTARRYSLPDRLLAGFSAGPTA